MGQGRCFLEAGICEWREGAGVVLGCAAKACRVGEVVGMVDPETLAEKEGWEATPVRVPIPLTDPVAQGQEEGDMVGLDVPKVLRVPLRVGLCV